jgi:aminoglycoside 6'-N-acetyltransferase
MQSDVYRYYIAEHEGRTIGAMQIIDPHLEPTHYWGDVAPNQRTLDIWIGGADDLSKGYGPQMMREAFKLCFADEAVTGSLIDPLASKIARACFLSAHGFQADRAARVQRR